MTTYPPRELKDLVSRDKLPNGPFVLKNNNGEEFQGFWLDLHFGMMIVPKISTASFVALSHLDGAEMSARPLEDHEVLEPEMADAMPKFGKTCKQLEQHSEKQHEGANP